MFNFRAMVRVLVAHDVEFAIVGGLAGVMQGAPINTQDLDILYSLEGANPARLLAAVQEMNATFGGDARKLRPGPLKRTPRSKT
jgi:hypothetical protein